MKVKEYIILIKADLISQPLYHLCPLYNVEDEGKE